MYEDVLCAYPDQELSRTPSHPGGAERPCLGCFSRGVSEGGELEEGSRDIGWPPLTHESKNTAGNKDLHALRHREPFLPFKQCSLLPIWTGSCWGRGQDGTMFLFSTTPVLRLSSTRTLGQAPSSPYPKSRRTSHNLLFTGPHLPQEQGSCPHLGAVPAFLCTATPGTPISQSPSVPLQLCSPCPRPTAHRPPLLSLAVLPPCSLCSRHT